jgi:hypothetical protein
LLDGEPTVRLASFTAPLSATPFLQRRIRDRVPVVPTSPAVIKQGPGWGWGSLLLPYLEQQPLFNQIDFTSAVEGPAALTQRTTQLAIYTCPSDPYPGVVTMMGAYGQPVGDAATNSYAACYGALGQIDIQPDMGNGLFVRNGRFRTEDVTDGLSTTLALGERATLLAMTPWAGVLNGACVTTTPGAPVYASVTEQAPTQVMARIGNRTLLDPNSEPYDFFSAHPNIVQFVFADGSVRILRDSTDYLVVQALATRGGGEAISSDAFE